jgi:fatty-acyl-CoA synthase
MDLSDLIDRNAGFAPQQEALRFANQVLHYEAFAARIVEVARALKSCLEVGRGDRVGILATNHPDYLVLLYACARLGAILVPLNWRLAVAEQVFILTNASVKILILEQAFAAVIAPLRQVLPELRAVGLDYAAVDTSSLPQLISAGTGEGRNPHTDFSCPLLIVYTSGTTGRPKGAVLRQEALLWNAVMSQHMHGLTAADHVLTVLPLFHVGGLNIQTTPALQFGATVTLHRRFDAQATLEALDQDHPTLTVLVPSTIKALLEHPQWHTVNLSRLRAITTGSTQVPQALIAALVERAIPVLQVYGATETCPIAVYTRLGGDRSRPQSTGLPGLLCEARIVDDNGTSVPHGSSGEVVVRGPNVFFEYWGDAAATRAALRNGWYHTGDIATRDDDGYFVIHDRKKNTIISGGENVYPAEIERVLHEHGAVAEAAVIGCSDGNWQEVPVAFVVSRPGAVIGAEELRAYLLGHLARFKVPRAFVFVESLPRNALGKLQHYKLREQAAAVGSLTGLST